MANYYKVITEYQLHHVLQSDLLGLHNYQHTNSSGIASQVSPYQDNNTHSNHSLPHSQSFPTSSFSSFTVYTN